MIRSAVRVPRSSLLAQLALQLLLALCATPRCGTGSAAGPRRFSVAGAQILRDGVPFHTRGANAMHVFGGDSSSMNTAGWKIGIVREFIGDLLHQPISGRVVHSGSSWLHPLQSIVDTNRHNSIVTILCPFGWDGTSDFSGSNPREMPFFVDYKRRWQAVAKQFANQSDVWLELWNEPYNWRGQNFSDSMWLSDAIEMVENIRSVNQNIIVVPGALDGQDESIILRQGRALLTGRSDLVFDVHGYERWMKSGITSTSVQERISAVADIGAAMLMGEVGPANANDMMDPRPLLSALKTTQTIALAWIWKCGGGPDSLLTVSCDPATPNDSGNNGWGSLFRNFTVSKTNFW